MKTEFMSSTFALHASEEDRALARMQALEELPRMSEAMVDEEGLLNLPQAGLLLNVSTKRISELVRERKLKSFQFFGRTYVSVKDVRKRYREGLKAGFPPLTKGQRIIASVRAALKTDRHQAALGGYAGAHVRAKHKQQKLKRKGKQG
jgi:hypothetical protein